MAYNYHNQANFCNNRATDETHKVTEEEEEMKLYGCTVFMVFLLKLVEETHGLNCPKFGRSDFPLPPSFVFGSGTSAYQVEGAAAEDGRTPSIWDTFAHSAVPTNKTLTFQPLLGKSKGNGDVAVDGYHQYKEDVKLMMETGLEAYRFSISWSRLIPNGRGPVNLKGLQYYNNLINELISYGIEPHVTLFHYDHPQILEDEYGGWLSQKIVKDFTAYADVCFREFGDRVSHWTTLNEVNIFVLGGYDRAIVPPGRCSVPFGSNCMGGNSTSEPYIVAHNCLLAHASTARLYKKKYQAKQHGFIGLNVFAYWLVPLTNKTEDVEATQRANDFFIGWFIEPLVFGDYPNTIKKNAGLRVPSFTAHESQQLKASFDFIGVNHYNTLHVKDDQDSLNNKQRDVMADMGAKLILKRDGSVPGSLPSGEFPINSWGLQGLLEYFKQNYGNPSIYIQENGQMTPRNVSFNDTSRVRYLESFIGSLLDAIRNGSNTKGYFSWSFLDLYELLEGYKSSFGLYYVDLNDPDLKRQPKLSSQWYSNFLKGGNVNSHQRDIKKNFSALSVTSLFTQ